MGMEWWFNQVGQPLTAEQKAEGMKHLREMLPYETTSNLLAILDAACYSIERGDGLDLLQTPQPSSSLRFLDLTGRFRLAAALAMPPVKQAAKELKPKLVVVPANGRMLKPYYAVGYQGSVRREVGGESYWEAIANWHNAARN